MNDGTGGAHGGPASEGPRKMTSRPKPPPPKIPVRKQHAPGGASGVDQFTLRGPETIRPKLSSPEASVPLQNAPGTADARISFGMAGLKRLWPSSVGQWSLAVAVLGLFAATVLPLFAWLDPRPAENAAPELRITEVSLDRLTEIDFEIYPGDEESPYRERGDAAIVDISLHNSGGTPALITEVSLTFVYAQAVKECLGVGGPLGISGTYDVGVPEDLPPVPFELREPMKFVVDPNNYDRLAVTIGPEHIP